MVTQQDIYKKMDQLHAKLKTYSVGIAGIGGLGSNAAVSLARTGIGKLVLVDYDTIDETNLNRQYYFRDQIGQLKTDAITKIIQNINPDTIVQTLNLRLEQGQMDKPFHDVDVIIEALDSAEIKTCFIEEILQKLPNTPLIAASGVTGYGNIHRLQIKHLGKLHIIHDEQAKGIEEDILTAPRVTVIANLQADLTIEVLLGEHQ